MSCHKLPNYLRTYRKRAGFSRAEVGFLIGVHCDQVTRFERFQRVPSYRTILAYKAVFKIPTSELFIGIYEPVCRGVRRRARLLLKRLSATAPTKANAHKLELLCAITEQQDADGPT